MKSRSGRMVVLFSILVALTSIVGFSSCSSPQSIEMPATGTFAITAKPFSHWHVLTAQKVEFTVTELASGKGKAGLPVEIQITNPASSQAEVRSVASKEVEDLGNGTYTLTYTALEFKPYAFSLRFMLDGQQFVSRPFVSEISKYGEEGIKVEAKGTSYVYQIRNFWSPGDVRASDSNAVTLSFEIMRGVPEGEAINWKEPYTNLAEHVRNAVSPEVTVESLDGKVKDKLSVVYKGKGIYEAKRLFTVAEVGKEKDYNIRFVFTDPYNGAVVTHSAFYPLHARAAD